VCLSFAGIGPIKHWLHATGPLRSPTPYNLNRKNFHVTEFMASFNINFSILFSLYDRCLLVPFVRTSNEMLNRYIFNAQCQTLSRVPFTFLQCAGPLLVAGHRQVVSFSARAVKISWCIILLLPPRQPGGSISAMTFHILHGVAPPRLFWGVKNM